MRSSVTSPDIFTDQITATTHWIVFMMTLIMKAADSCLFDLGDKNDKRTFWSPYIWIEM